MKTTTPRPAQGTFGLSQTLKQEGLSRFRKRVAVSILADRLAKRHGAKEARILLTASNNEAGVEFRY